MTHPIIARWKQNARRLKIEVYALYLAYRDPRVPWPARVFAACVAGYAFSPIDLIPDVIPILGYLDDLVLVPFGIWLALKMIPAPVLDECRLKSREMMAVGKPVNRVAAVVIVGLWLAAAVGMGLLVARLWGGVGITGASIRGTLVPRTSSPSPVPPPGSRCSTSRHTRRFARRIRPICWPTRTRSSRSISRGPRPPFAGTVGGSRSASTACTSPNERRRG